MSRCHAVALAVAAALAAAPGASAQSGVVAAPEAGRSYGEVVLAGGSALWAQSDDRLTTRLFGARLGAWRPASLATAAPLPGAAKVAPAVSGSESGALLSVVSWACVDCRLDPPPLGNRVLAGPWGALRPVAAGAEDPSRHPTLSGDRVAYRVPTADGGLTIRLVDPVSGERTDVPAEPTNAWAAAGDLVAVQQPRGEWVVWNWRTGTELYRPRFGADTRSVSWVRLTANGEALWRLVADRGAFGTEVDAVSTPAAPAARELTRPGTVLGIANGRLLARDDAGGARVTDLEERDVAVFSDPGARGFDGSRIAWIERPCAVPLVAVWDVAAGDPRPSVPSPLCPGARSGRPSVRGGAVRLPLRCAGSAVTGCHVSVSVTVVPAGRRARGALADVVLNAGERRTVRLRTWPRAVPRGPVRITVRTQPADRPAPGERRVSRHRLRVR